MSDTPETDGEWNRIACYDHPQFEQGIAEFARKLERERDEARGQRDRLAAVLQRIRDGYGGQAATPNCCEDCDFLIPIDEALATSNQPNP